MVLESYNTWYQRQERLRIYQNPFRFHVACIFTWIWMAVRMRIPAALMQKKSPCVLRMCLIKSRAQAKPPSVASHLSCPTGGSPRSATMFRMLFLRQSASALSTFSGRTLVLHVHQQMPKIYDNSKNQEDRVHLVIEIQQRTFSCTYFHIGSWYTRHTS